MAQRAAFERERLVAQVAVIQTELPPEPAQRLLERLDEV